VSTGRTRGVWWLGLIGLAGCAVNRPAPLPPVPEATQREMVNVKSTRCARGVCRTTVAVGAVPLTVEARARLMSRSEALGERRSTPAVVGAFVLDELLVLAGASVGRDQVGLGTRTVTSSADSSSRLECRNGWVQETVRTREDGTETSTVQRLAEGMDCELRSAADSVVSWRFHAGSTAAATALVREAGSSRNDRRAPRLDLRLRLEQVTASAAVGYRVGLDSVSAGAARAPLSSWGIERPDGTRVATLQWRYGVGSSAIDWHGTVTASEKQALRLAAAALAAPLMETR